MLRYMHSFLAVLSPTDGISYFQRLWKLLI